MNLTSEELNKLVTELNRRNLTIAFAESVTAGKLCYEFSTALNASKALKGSLVAYNVEVKKKLLNVQQETLEKYTAESKEVTHEMVRGLKSLFDADFLVAITGLANPGGSESREKPVGTVFLSILHKEEEFHYRQVFLGNHDSVIGEACSFSLQKVKEIVTN